MSRYRHLITDENRKWWTLGAMCLALFMIMLDNTVVNVALPSIQRDLDTSISGLEWIVNGYTLSFAVLLVVGGRLGDIFGRRKMFLLGVVIFTLSSVTAGFAVDNLSLIASRVVQGAGAALMMPGTLSIITDAFPPSERGKAIGTWAGVSAVALAIGPVLGGFLTEHVDWRAIFFINVPVGILAVLAAIFAVRESRDTTVGRRVDVLGVAVLTVSLTALVLALIEGNNWGWGSTAIVGLIAGSVVAFVLFAVVERRVTAPIIEFALFNSRNFIGAVTVAFIISFAMLGVFFFFALYMQNILGYSPLEAGIRFLPTTLVIMVLAPLAGRLSDRIGPRWPMVIGMALVSVALYMLSTIEVGTTFSHILPGFVLLGAGIGMTMSPMSTAAMNSVATAKAGVASGVLSMFRMVGGTFGIAALGALFQGQAKSRLDQTFSGAGLTGAERSDFAHQLTGGAPHVDGLSAAQAAKVTAAGQDAFVYGLSHAMVLSLSVAILGVLVALLMIRGHGKSHEEEVGPVVREEPGPLEDEAGELAAPGSAAPVT
ncbi:MAG: MFS transporter [Solirubrobacterales bacterium]|nr:MFS transporter [Solirubrobacterales bacterium]